MKTRDWFLFWLLGIIWGTSFLWIKIAVQEISPLVLVGFRALFGALGILVILLVSKSREFSWSVIKPNLFNFFILGLVNIALPFLLISWAEQFIDSGIASILNGTMPLFTIWISPIFISDDRITPPKVIGLITGFIGVVILMYPSIRGGWSSSLLGQAAVLLAAFFYASATVFARRQAGKLPPILQAFLQLAWGAAIVWSLAFAFETPLALPALPLTWVALLWLGLLGSCLAYIIYFNLLHQIGPTRMSMVTYIPPLVGVVLGVLFLGEQFSWTALVGALLILSGITIVNQEKIPVPKTKTSK